MNDFWYWTLWAAAGLNLVLSLIVWSSDRALSTAYLALSISLLAYATADRNERTR